MSAPAVQDASWLSYSCRIVTLRHLGGKGSAGGDEGGGGGQGGGGGDGV